ncbi:MAG: ribosome maturation factor RimP [Holosporales bacterium]|jgi:ribosome maturation factor RimP|nr:ribosome maturation factor RimP [Holosporales bacterium]
MSIAEKIQSIVGESLRSRGYGIVDIVVSGGRINPTVEVLIERLDGAAITVSDCTGASRVVSALLDVENVIDNSYRLNVSSPGIERPLTKLEHFARFIGKCAVVEVASSVSDRKKFTGTIVAVKEDESMPNILLHLKIGQKTIELPFSDIKKARLKIDEF